VNNPARTLRSFWPCFFEVVKGCQSALEIGAGEGNNLRNTYAKRRVAIECYRPYVKQGGDVEFLVGDALKILPTLASKSFELILMIDILEHFWREDAEFVLREVDRIASKKVLLFCPEGLMIQNETWHDDYREWSEGLTHRSSWTAQELEKDWDYDATVWNNYHNNYITGEQSIPACFAIKCF
jgi:hypothetical protein